MLRIRPGLVSSFGFPSAHTAGDTGSVAVAPNVAITGAMMKYDSTAPAIIRQATRGPRMNPTPINSGESSPSIWAPFNPVVLAPSVVYNLAVGSSDQRRAPWDRSLCKAAIPNPTNTHLADAPPRSPDLSTSAQANPSG